MIASILTPPLPSVDGMAALTRTVIASGAWQSRRGNRVSLGNEIATSLRSSR